MPWPQAQDYNEAIQNPRFCFTDPELKQARVKVNALGLPSAISGAFASVYQVDTPNGKWAIRCFVREVSDTHYRYKEISKTLSTLSLPYTAPFEFQPNGIKVMGNTYPIVKMKWMGGKLLTDYIAENVNNPAQLASLADKWVLMIKALNQHKIAHGDLQHGNILVVNNELMLIDYDGMYVPSFKGARANELGHPDYQHPKRSEVDFGNHIDNFSSWIIYASLKILAEQPSIYSLSRGLGRDESILFNRDDFKNPHSSPIFGHIKSTSDENTVKLCNKLIDFLSSKVSDIPLLDTSAYTVTAAAIITSNSSNGPSDWWKTEIKKGPSNAALQQNLAAVVPLKFGPQPKLMREIILLLCLSASMLFGLFFTGYLGGAGYSICQIFIFIFAKFRLDSHCNASSEMAAKNRHLQEVALKSEIVVEKKSHLEKIKKRQQEIQKLIISCGETLQKEIADFTGNQGNEIRTQHSDNASKRVELDKSKRLLTAEIQNAFLNTTAPIETEIRASEAQIKHIGIERDNLIRAELDALRSTLQNQFLRSHLLYHAIIPGIGNTFKFRLVNNGIQTAADVTVAKIRVIEGFGYTRTSAMMQWKESIVLDYQSKLPTKLSQSTLYTIDSRILIRKTEIERKISVLRAKLQSAKQAVDYQFKNRSDNIQAQESNLTSSNINAIESITKKYNNLIASKRSAHGLLVQNLKKEEIALSITASNLQTEIGNLESWLTYDAPVLNKSFAELTIENFIKAIFSTP